MIFTPFRGDADRVRMLELVQQNPIGHVHVIDLPYRLSSWAFDNPGNIGLWEDSDGKLLAWAVLQTPFWMLDYGLDSAAPPDAPATILAWAGTQAAALLDTRFGHESWFAGVLAGQVRWRQALESAGFVAQDDDANAWTQVTLALEASVELPHCAVREGFRLRPLRGEAEVPAYVALHRMVFESNNMTEGWRQEVLHHPAYRPELDLVVEDSVGSLAAFCIAWIAKLPRSNTIHPTVVGQIEPLGVREDGRRHGLAWAVLAEAVNRLRALGAEVILVQTDRDRNRALTFYHSAGFRVVENIIIYRKDFRPGD